MTLKRNVRAYWNAFILILLLIIPGVGHSSNYPEWLQAYHDGTLKLDNFYYGVGSSNFYGDKPGDDSRRRSKDRALDELCYQLSVSIKSEFKENLTQIGKYSDQKVASSLFVSTQKVFSGIQEKHKWTDSQNSIYWVMLTIDKTEADRQVKQQDFIKKVVDRLENNQQEITAGIQKMTAVLIQQGKIHEAQFNNLEKLMETIDKKMGSAGDQAKAEYTGIKSEINNLGNKWNKQEEMLLDQNKKMDVLMSQNQTFQDLIAKILKYIQGDHFLALAQDDVKNQIKNPEFNVKIAPDKGQGAEYYEDEEIRFHVEASRDCYIKVIYLSSIGEDVAGETKMNTMLFPNVLDRDNFIVAGKPTIIGKKNYSLIAGEPYGKDIVTVVASLTQFTDIEKSLSQAAQNGQYYQKDTKSVRDAEKFRGRGVVSFVSDTCFINIRKKKLKSEPILWITPDEAALKDPPPLEILRSHSMGPKILIEMPKDGGTYTTPLSIQVKFIANNDSSINIGSIKVLYLKWMLTKDITDKIKKYVSAQGIDVADAPLPKGKHTIQISLADFKKQETTIRLSFTIN